ncbi:MAG: hypothetical protein KY055_00615 [Candidatus Nealsonbacteria bacterium]|nr:hypothetical protein [Candidatus Nealsonbacteria bacterium]
MENKKNDKKLLFLTLFCILVLSLVTYWRFKNFQESLPEIQLPQFKLPKVEIKPLLPINEFLEENYKEFVSQDKKFKMKYPAGWTEGRKELLLGLNRERIKTDENEGGKILFFNHKMRVKEPFLSFLMVWEFKGKQNLENFLEKIKKQHQGEREVMEIVGLEKGEDFIFFEAVYLREGHPFFSSKEKIIWGKEKTYLVSFYVSGIEWGESIKEAEFIFDSIVIAQ